MKTNRGQKAGREHSEWAGDRIITPQGYVKVYAPWHPKARGSRVEEHALVAERALGKFLPDGAIVHHHNRIRTDNRPANLVVCPDQAYHRLIHQRMDALEACGDANWRKCKYCKRYDDPSNLVALSRKGTAPYHQPCANAYALERKARIRGR